MGGRCWVVAILIGLGLGTPAVHAGPWARGKGQTFLTFSLSYDLSSATFWQSAYAERGLTDRATLIVDQGASPEGAFQLSARYSRRLWPEADWASSWSLGVIWRDQEPGVVGGLAVGRGLELAGKDGWITADVSALATAHRAQVTADLTFGLTLDNGVKLYGQMLGKSAVYSPVTGVADIPPEVRIGVNAAVPLRDGLLLDLGASHGLHPGGSGKVKLGLWMTF